MPYREGTLMGAGDVPLRYWAHTVESARANCLVVHGVGEHAGRYRHVAAQLNAWSLTVWALDYRGHGRSGGVRGHCHTFGDLLDDVGRVLAQMRVEHPQGRTVLVGHSLGGLLVLAYALEHPQGIQAVIASSPALALSLQPAPLKRFLAKTLGRLWPTLRVSNGVQPDWLSHDPAVVDAYRTDPLVHPWISLGGYLEIQKAMARTRARAADLTVPTLILQAGEDRLVSAAASRQFAAQVTSPGSAYHEYPGFYHELFNEVGRDQVFADLRTWLLARLN